VSATPERLPGRLIEGLGGAALAVLEIVALVFCFGELSDARRGAMSLILVISIITGFAVIAAGILSIVNLFPLRRHVGTLAKTILWLSYGAIGVVAIMSLVMAAVIADAAAVFLTSLNALALILGTFFLFGGGWLTLLTALMQRPRRVSVPGADTESRLQKLRELHERGLITDQEFEAKRRRSSSRYRCILVNKVRSPRRNDAAGGVLAARPAASGCIDTPFGSPASEVLGARPDAAPWGNASFRQELLEYPATQRL